MPQPIEKSIDLGGSNRLHIRSLGDGSTQIELIAGGSSAVADTNADGLQRVIEAAAQVTRDAIAP